jgi:hypothetical protein
MRFHLSNPARLAGLALAAMAIATCVAGALWMRPAKAAAADPGQNSGQPQPVLVELFTSEGCSSCPPADELLARLDASQFVHGARAIVLSEHVTYWDHLGWRDPYSLESVTRRQTRYGQLFRLDSIYTPQIVVDGATQLEGDDSAALKHAIAQAAATPKIDLTIQNAAWSGAAVQFNVRGAGNGSGASLIVVLAEDSAQSSVARGENAGRKLRHVAVVRALEEFSEKALDGRKMQLTLPDTLQSAPNEAFRLIVFLADRNTGHVLAVAEQPITRQPQAAGAQLATSLPDPSRQPAQPR